MDKREIIAQTMINMHNIYLDVGRVIQVIEEQAKNSKLMPVGTDSYVIWENSGSFLKPDAWLLSWFARVYQDEKQAFRAVGFCVHLGGERYEIADLEYFPSVGIPIPFINISMIETETNIAQIKRPLLNNFFWAGGWCNQDKINKISDRSLVYSEEDSVIGKVKSTSYFVDLLELNSKEKINQLVVTPMAKMLAGEELWVLENNLPVIKLLESNIIEE